jgi:hypothetical protein
LDRFPDSQLRGRVRCSRQGADAPRSATCGDTFGMIVPPASLRRPPSGSPTRQIERASISSGTSRIFAEYCRPMPTPALDICTAPATSTKLHAWRMAAASSTTSTRLILRRSQRRRLIESAHCTASSARSAARGEQRRQVRQARAKPLLDQLYRWLPMFGLRRSNPRLVWNDFGGLTYPNRRPFVQVFRRMRSFHSYPSLSTAIQNEGWSHLFCESC